MIIPDVLTCGSDAVAVFYVYASGVAEIICGILLIIRQTRNLGRLATIALRMTLIFTCFVLQSNIKAVKKENYTCCLYL